MSQVRQGDIFFEKVSEKPSVKEIDASRFEKTNSPIVAYGEVTGHSHMLEGEFEHFVEKNETSLREQYIVSRGVTIKHDEHSPHFLSEGVWKSWRQRSLDPSTLEPKPVID